MIILAAGLPTSTAIAAWLILAGRGATAIPHVRAQIARLHHRPTSSWLLLGADATAFATAGLAVLVDPAVAAGAAAIFAVVTIQRITDRTPVPAKVIGIRQSVLGLVVVVATAIGLHLA
jgi:hypothetical protein